METQENLTPGARSEAFTGGRIDRRKMTNLEIKMRRKREQPTKTHAAFCPANCERQYRFTNRRVGCC